MSHRPDEKCLQCDEIRARENAEGAARRYCNLEPTVVFPNIRTCPKDYSPLNCSTCSKNAEDCIQKYNLVSLARGCASHTDAVKNILSSIPTCDLVREIERREGVDATSVLPGWSYEVEKNPPENEDDDENIYNSLNDESDNPGRWSSLSGEGPAKILVVVD